MRIRSIEAMAGCLCVAAFSVTPAVAQSSLPESIYSGVGSVLGAPINFTVGETELELDAGGALNFTVPAGFVLSNVQCPAGVQVTASRFGASLVPNGNASLGACVVQIVNVVAAAGALVPVIFQRNQQLLSVELGLDHQLGRFGSSEGANGSFPKPNGLGVGSSAFSDTGRMGLMSSGDAAPVSFSTSMQQSRSSQQLAPPNMLGAVSRPPAASPSRSFNVWAEGYLAHVESDDRYGSSDGHSGVLFVGADYLISPYLLLGMLVQYDDQDRKFDGAPLHFSDNGWLTGPYAVIRLADQVFFQGRAAWGQSRSDIRLDGVFDDSFDSDRWLVKGRLLANLHSGAWLLRPSVSVAYVEDELEGYRSSSGIGISGRRMSLGQAKFGPEIAYRYRASADYVITPSVTLEGIWTFEEENTGRGFDDLVDTSAVRGRAEAGTTVETAQGMSVGIALSYDGIGSSDFTAIGGRARVNVPLN